MKRKWTLAVFIAFLMSGLCIQAQSVFAFDSGSTGALGALNPASSTQTEIELPADGILNYTTINIPQGATVTFKKNAANTPVYMLATGDVTIAGTISVNGSAGVALAPGKGGPGGYDGGLGAAISYCGGTGLGFGGGQAAKYIITSATYGGGGGGGGFGSAGANGIAVSVNHATGGTGGSTYGNENLLPIIGGSGGGGGCSSVSYGYYAGGGGGGGGAIVIASSGIINVTGSITANGAAGSNVAYGAGGGASGGAIKLIADIISGNGTISATGGAGGSYSGAGGAGRIRLEANTLQRTSNTTPSYTFAGFPVGVFPSVMPTLKITKVGGTTVPASPTGAYATPDVILPSNAANPVDIVVEATNIPTGTTVTITCVPEVGASKTATTTLSGTQDLSTGTAQITISNGSANVLMATATFTFQIAANQMPIYADGEKVVKMRIASVFGGKSSITYITETGKEILANI